VEQFVAFVLRVFRLGPALSQEALHVVIQPEQYQQLEEIWTYPNQSSPPGEPPARTIIGVEIPSLQMSRAFGGNNYSGNKHQEVEDVSSAESDNTTDYTESEDNVTPHEIDDG
jgi:hypothetical protein